MGINGADPLVAAWSLWMRAGGLSDRTIRERELTASRVCELAEPTRADWKDVARFLAHEGWQPRTRATYHRHLNAFFSWLVDQGERDDNPVSKLPVPREPRSTPIPFNDLDLDRPLRTRSTSRTRAAIILGAYAGLRVAEIAQVHGHDILVDDIRVYGKGGVIDDIPLHPTIRAIAKQMPTGDWWFPSTRRPGEHTKGNVISVIVSQAMTRASVPGTAHTLRHWFGNATLQTPGGNMRTTQSLLRHAQISTTQRYTRADQPQRRAAVAALPVAARTTAA